MANVLLATGAYDREIRFWEPHTGQCYRTIRYPDGQINRLQFSPNRKYLAAAGHGHVRLFDVNTTNPSALLSFDEHKMNVTGIDGLKPAFVCIVQTTTFHTYF